MAGLLVDGGFCMRAAPKKLGKKVDITKSQVADPGAWDAVKVAPQTAWRTDRMKNMTYTQFWQLVNERRVDKVPLVSSPWACPACLCALEARHSSEPHMAPASAEREAPGGA